MERKVAFIGHRNLWGKSSEIEVKLYKEVEKQIQNGCKFFTMGTHGEFDKIALKVCRILKRTYPDIIIEVAITSLHTITPIINHDPIWGYETYKPYSDVTTVMYDIEEQYFKQKITISNQQMLNLCDTLICYVDTTKTYGGAILAYKYAKKKDLRIVNLYQEKNNIIFILFLIWNIFVMTL